MRTIVLAAAMALLAMVWVFDPAPREGRPASSELAEPDRPPSGEPEPQPPRDPAARDDADSEPPASAEPDGPPSMESGSQRFAVVWSSIRLSEDRRTVTVTTWYPLAGLCVKQADGVDVEVRGDTAVVAAWMRGPDSPLPENAACTMECGHVTQSVTLQEPLPARVAGFEPVAHAVSSCA